MRHSRQARDDQCAPRHVQAASACGAVCQGIVAACVVAKLGAAVKPEALAVAAAQCPRTCSWRGASVAP